MHVFIGFIYYHEVIITINNRFIVYFSVFHSDISNNASTIGGLISRCYCWFTLLTYSNILFYIRKIFIFVKLSVHNFVGFIAFSGTKLHVLIVLITIQDMTINLNCLLFIDVFVSSGISVCLSHVSHEFQWSQSTATIHTTITPRT